MAEIGSNRPGELDSFVMAIIGPAVVRLALFKTCEEWLLLSLPLLPPFDLCCRYPFCNRLAPVVVDRFVTVWLLLSLTLFSPFDSCPRHPFATDYVPCRDIQAGSGSLEERAREGRSTSTSKVRNTLHSFSFVTVSLPLPPGPLLAVFLLLSGPFLAV